MKADGNQNMRNYSEVQALLTANPRHWLVTGVAGFIGSNLLEALLKLDQQVTGLDHFATGYARNMDEVRQIVGAGRSRNFTFIEGDIRNLADCRRACAGVDFVLHHAALGSVPRSIEDPLAAHDSNPIVGARLPPHRNLEQHAANHLVAIAVQSDA